MFKLSLVFTAILFSVCLLSAQSSQTNNMMSFSGESVEALENSTRSIYTDQENKICFVDFQSLNINLNEIIVRDKSGAIVMEDKVFDLPVDTIYEIHLDQLKGGNYSVELKSFTKVIVKEITVR
ncbi:MAG: hypothetical protein HC912_03260 [Saprospiraceae bacterium]|nr:hypothetical protein [Saprospiraceae bacterium]